MSKTSFAMFLAGATVGAAATWLCLKRYYEQIAQEEIDSVKAAFAERKPVNTNIAKSESRSVLGRNPGQYFCSDFPAGFLSVRYRCRRSSRYVCGGEESFLVFFFQC